MAAKFSEDEDIIELRDKRKRIAKLVADYDDAYEEIEYYLKEGTKYDMKYLTLKRDMKSSETILEKSRYWPADTRTYRELGYAFINEDLKALRMGVLQERLELADHLKIVENNMKKLGIYVVQQETVCHVNTIAFQKLSIEITELENKIREKELEKLNYTSQPEK